MHFIALALKTANENLTSLCSLELTIVKNNRIIETKSWSFYPEPSYISPLNQYLYGVHAIDFIDQPSFVSQWPEIQSYLENQLILCDQFSYTYAVLHHLIKHHQLDYPNCYFSCLKMISKCFFTHIENRKLTSICKALEINYHPKIIGETSIACANVLLKISKKLRSYSVEETLDLLGISLGQITHQSIFLSEFKEHKHSPHEVLPSDKLLDLKGQVICITGALETMTRVQAVKKIHQLHATYTNTVNNQTTVLLTNTPLPNQSDHMRITSKMQATLRRINEGQSITIINEAQFLDLFKELL